MSDTIYNPKLFVSYCWSSIAHEQWVIQLASDLSEQGVEVILDKWDLKEGQDAVAFMETMVTDKSVTKVIMICDKTYAEKADGRAGGVGTETQIISREVYDKTNQSKFVAILPEKDEDGKPYLPTYYKSRIYIDLSDGENFQKNYEQLLRWIFDKPLHVKPAIGARPAFLAETTNINLGTGAAFRRAIDAVKTSKDFANGAVDEYLSTFTANMERFRMGPLEGDDLDEIVVKSIEEFIPYRDQFIEMLVALARYRTTSDIMRSVHRFFERMIPYMHRPQNTSNYKQIAFDNYRYITYELFIYAIAILVSEERFGFVNYLLQTPYYIDGDELGRDATTKSYEAFREPIRTLDHRNQRLNLRLYEIRTMLLEKYNKSACVSMKSLMQADLILYIRGAINSDYYGKWWPSTLILSERSYSPFEIFARSASTEFFIKAMVVLGVNSADDLRIKMERFRVNQDLVPKWGFTQAPIFELMNLDKIASQP